MSALSLASFGVAVLLYAAASTLFYLDVAAGEEVAARTRWAPVFLGVAGLGHFTYVLIASFVAKVCPVHSLHFLLSIASLIATVTYLFARRKFKVNALGIIVAPVGLMVTLGTFFLGTSADTSSLPIAFTGFHVFANLVGVALFLLACGAAIMYLIQERRLKKKKLLLGKKSNLPALDSLDKAIHRFLILGFPLLTVGVASGTVWARELELGSPDMVLRTIVGYGTWLLIAAILILRGAAGWRGRRAAYGAVAGFICEVVMLSFYLLRPVVAAG